MAARLSAAVRRDAVEAALAVETKASRLSGVQVVITEGGTPVLDLAGGSHPGSGRPITSDTRFPWYSATKPVAAAALHLLAARGEVSYDEAVAAYLPDFAQGAKGSVTLRQILTHTAGLPDLAGSLSLDAFADPEALRQAICALPLEYPPGDKVVNHGHTATAVVAIVVEAVTNAAFRDVVQELVLDPCNMTRTGWHPDAETTDVEAHAADLAAVASELRAASARAVLSGAGLYGPAADLARFYTHLSDGTLLPGNALDEVTRLHAPYSPNGTLGFGLHMMVGCDPDLADSRGGALSTAAYWHPGWTCALAVHEPVQEATVVILTNLALPQDESDARLARICAAALGGRPAREGDLR